ncbi:rhamnulokinase [bacterium]|nr:rhamnulokinase [bacterium]
MLGFLEDGKFRLEEIHRFINGPVKVGDSLFWDVLRMWSEIKASIRLAIQKYGGLQGIGVDTWGVDFALLGRGDILLGNPYHYRDKRTNGMLEEAFRRVPKEKIYFRTGIQFIQLNTLYQLLAMRVENSPLLDIAETFLMMPDLFNFWLTGIKANEFSIATTSQFYNPLIGDWDRELLEEMDIPHHFLQRIVSSGTILGEILPSVGEEVGQQGIPVIAVSCHDTGSAVAAAPAEGDDWAYISAGTWMLMGVEIKEPIINQRSFELNFTNEGGVGGTFRFLKNIMGLWLIQESRRTWANRGEEYSYSELTKMAENARPFCAILEPDHTSFLPPGDMPARIADFCRKTGQEPPQTKGEFVRCALESLALKCKWVLDRLEEMLGRQLSRIHIFGGGSQNTLLCQFIADATDRIVMAGPVEATATGNALVQALALGYIKSHEEMREIIRNSFEVIPYEPAHTAEWDDAYERFLKIMESVQ